MMLAGLAIPLGCDTEAETMGEVDLVAVVGGDTFIGVLADDDGVVAYVCDGTDSEVMLAEWFIMKNDGGSFEATNTVATDTGTIDVSIRGSFTDGAATGTLTIDGEASDFEANGSSGDEGTYRAQDDDYLAAWVVVGNNLRGAVINRNTGDLFAAGNIQPTAAFDFMGVSLTPSKLTISDY
jgi:DNA-binding beta-propeller fold protein YncE